MYKESKVSVLQTNVKLVQKKDSLGLGIRGYERPWLYPHWEVIFCHWILHLSVILSHGVSGRHPSRQTSPQADTILDRHPPRQTPLGRLPLGRPLETATAVDSKDKNVAFSYSL